MPNVRIKKYHLDKLKELGVYELWMSNVSKQWENHQSCWINPSSYRYDMYEEKLNRNVITFERFICYSFSWSNTDEGRGFWGDISNKLND